MMPQLEQIYLDRYQGSEHSVMFRPGPENTIGIEVELKVPHVIATSKTAIDAFNKVFDRLLRQASVECVRAAMEAEEELRANGDA